MSPLSRAVGAEVRKVEARERDGKPARAIVAVRTYPTDLDDLWNALTDPARIARWFAPVEGDLKLGGRYQVQGNAGGTITRCDPPRAFDLTWEFAGATSWVSVSLAAEGEGARLTLEHTVLTDDVDKEHWATYGPGAVGIGWELGLMGLGLHFASGGAKPPEADPAWMASDEAKAFIRESGEGWAAADIDGGEDPETARARAQRTVAFYSGG